MLAKDLRGWVWVVNIKDYLYLKKIKNEIIFKKIPLSGLLFNVACNLWHVLTKDFEGLD